MNSTIFFSLLYQFLTTKNFHLFILRSEQKSSASRNMNDSSFKLYITNTIDFKNVIQKHSKLNEKTKFSHSFHFVNFFFFQSVSICLLFQTKNV